MSANLITTSALSHIYLYFVGKALVLARHAAHAGLGQWMQGLKWASLALGVTAFTSEQMHFWLRLTWTHSILLACISLGATAYALRRVVP